MTHDEICNYINQNIVYRPGYRFAAYPVGQQIELRVSFPTHNSNQADARRAYPDDFIRVDYQWLDPERMTDIDGIWAEVLTAIMEVELHEAREFLRDRLHDFRAPFHPHRDEGKNNYAKHFLAALSNA